MRRVLLMAAILSMCRAQDLQTEVQAAWERFDFERAATLSRDLLEAVERQHGAVSAPYARALAQHARITGAGDLYLQAATVLEASAPNDPVLAEALYGAAVHAQVARRHEEARALYTRALEAAERTGARAVAARVLHNLAVTAMTTDPAQAEGYLRREIEIESALGAGPRLALALETYARVLADLGRAAEAADAKRRAGEARTPPATRRQSAPAPEGGAYRVGGDVAPPMLVYKVEPKYSEEARAAHLEGTVVLYAEVTPEGVARNLRVIRPAGLGLDHQAVRAVQQWRFDPGKKEGVPVTVAATIEVNFRLL